LNKYKLKSQTNHILFIINNLSKLNETLLNQLFIGLKFKRNNYDESQEKTFNLWIVADNLRKGAATNAVQIATLVQKRIF
jgi:aspartate-semialdehyde dehydrogenase